MTLKNNSNNYSPIDLIGSKFFSVAFLATICCCFFLLTNFKSYAFVGKLYEHGGEGSVRAKMIEIAYNAQTAINSGYFSECMIERLDTYSHRSDEPWANEPKPIRIEKVILALKNSKPLVMNPLPQNDYIIKANPYSSWQDAAELISYGKQAYDLITSTQNNAPVTTTKISGAIIEEVSKIIGFKENGVPELAKYCLERTFIDSQNICKNGIHIPNEVFKLRLRESIKNNSCQIYELPVRSIYEKYKSLGGNQSFLGKYKTDSNNSSSTDVNMTIDFFGLYSQFEYGRIYWQTQRTHRGPFETHGAIYNKFIHLGGEQGELGYPTSDEINTSDKTGRVSFFQHGNIYWKNSIGAYAIMHFPMQKWTELGGVKSCLGYPVSEKTIYDTLQNSGTNNVTVNRFLQKFENGTLYWDVHCKNNEGCKSVPATLRYNCN